MREYELKPCPFCGGDPVDEAGYEIFCPTCVIGSDLEWNTRPIESELQERIAALEIALGVAQGQLEAARERLAEAEQQAAKDREIIHSLNSQLREYQE